MYRARLLFACAVIVAMTAAIGAAPVVKRPAQPSTEVALPQHDSRDKAPIPEVPTEVSTEADKGESPVESISESPVESLAPAIQSATSPSAAVNMDWYSINNGGAIEVAAGNIKMGLSIGQNAVGEVSAGNIKMGLGFWYGAGSGSAPTCPCACHGDPVCDSLPDIIDVATVVGVAFRNDPAIPDPNGQCNVQTTDVDCSGFTDIIDVARMVNVAFRFADPDSEFCNPCSPTL